MDKLYHHFLQKRKKRLGNAYVFQTILNRSLDIQTIQSTIFCSDVDIATFESAFSNGHTRFGLIPISLCGVFFFYGIPEYQKEGRKTNINTILYVYDESKSLPIWLNPTEIAWSTWSTVVWPAGIFHVPVRVRPVPEKTNRGQNRGPLAPIVRVWTQWQLVCDNVGPY